MGVLPELFSERIRYERDGQTAWLDVLAPPAPRRKTSPCGADTGDKGFGFGRGNTCAAGEGDAPFDRLVGIVDHAEKIGLDLPDSAFGEDQSDDALMADAVAEYVRIHTAPLLSVIGEVRPANVTENTGMSNFAENKRKALKHLGLADASLEDIAALAGLDKDAAVVVTYDQSPRDLSPVITLSSQDGFRSRRQIRKDEYGFHIENQIFEAKETGTGLGTKVLARQIAAAQKMGIESLRCFATRGAGTNGYYTWPRLGYDEEIMWANVRASREGRIAWEQAPESVRACKRYSDLMANTESREWWKEHGVAADLVFDLKEGSESLKVFREYLAARGML